MATSIIGALVAPWNVEQAVLGTIATWLDFYLYDLERQNGLPAGSLPRPPAPESLAGGMDFDSWQEDLLPAVIAVCNPVGDAELNLSVGYSQTYQADLAVITLADDEQSARQRAGLYAAAIVGSLIQRGSLGGFATRTRLVGAPRVELPDPDIRVLARGECSFHVEVDQIASDQAGPTDPTPPTDPSAPPDAPPTFTAPPGITVTGAPLTP